MTMPANKAAPKAIVTISSHVMRGAVGNRAAVFALEQLGFRAWSVPTILLPWHPGHGAASRLVPPSNVFSDLLEDLAQSRFTDEIVAVTSGYLGSPDQANAIARFVDAIKAKKPDVRYVCDPVIGDAGGLYVPTETAEAIRDTLMPIADCMTPNRFEFAWLYGSQPRNNVELAKAALKGRPATHLITSAFGSDDSQTGNLLVEAYGTHLCEHRSFAHPPNGTGDLTTALFAGHMSGGLPAQSALTKTTTAVFNCIERTLAANADELVLNRSLNENPDTLNCTNLEIDAKI